MTSSYLKKFSQSYVEYIEHEELGQIYKIISDDNIFPNTSDESYKWSNLGYSLLFIKGTDKTTLIETLCSYCFQIEKIIVRQDYEAAKSHVINFILPLLDKLNSNEINIIIAELKLTNGPLYKQLWILRLPKLILDYIEKYNS